MTTRIYLIRHGESEWNTTGRYTGQQDIPLSPLGKEQAERLASRLERENLEAIYSSPLARARETAEAIAETKGLTLRLDPGLAEIHHGAWEGLTARDVSERYAEEYDRWQSAPHDVRMPDGESLEEVARRAISVFEQIRQAHQGRTVAISSHDAVLRVLLLCALELPLDRFWDWRFENASISLIEAVPVGRRFRLALLNETGHLGDFRAPFEHQAL